MTTPVRLTALITTAFCLALPAQDAKAKVDFEKQIWPILEKRCLECHATEHTDADGKVKKPKGRVVLDTKEGIEKSKRGKLVVAKKSGESVLYESITLPADDEDRMPPAKAGDPLSKEQIELIQKWIDDGADFGKWTGKAKGKDGDKGKDKGKEGGTEETPKPGPKRDGDKKQSRADMLDALQKGLEPLPAATLATFADSPFTVRSLGDGSPLLQVACAGRTDEVDDAAVTSLAPLAGHIAELELGRTRIGDDACRTIAGMPRLVHLDLRQTGVGDHGVAALAANQQLRSLNLFGTKVGDYAAAALAGLKHLEHLYVWQTEVSAAAVVRLRESVPGVRVVLAADLPEPMADAPASNRRGR
ncbi:MAG: hypothetical protein JNL08_01005 [Planctomycetes bacterium]|nr:hypothetical protein [Planctomycetota bacterium]